MGISGRHHTPYYSLPPGDYVYHLQTTTPLGEPIGSEVALAVSIPQVFWKRPSTLALSAGAFAVAVAVVVRTMVRRRLQARLDQAERRRRLERERLRIAQDIHDDLGASLTHINLLSQTAAGKMEKSHAAWKDIEHLRALAVALTQKLDEIVWVVSPRHDTLESLLSYLTDLAEDFLGAAGVRTRIHVPIQLPAWTLESGLRHNVFLATKEALNNVVKHAQATEVRLQLVIMPGAFELTIQDNGCGFSPLLIAASGAERSPRHGLEGVKWRIESLGGKFSLDSAPGRGTQLTFTVPVDAAETNPQGAGV